MKQIGIIRESMAIERFNCGSLYGMVGNRVCDSSISSVNNEFSYSNPYSGNSEIYTNDAPQLSTFMHGSTWIDCNQWNSLDIGGIEY